MRTVEPREMTVVSGGVLQKQPHEEGAPGDRLKDWLSKFTQLDAGGGALEEVLVKASKPGSGGFEEGRIDPASLLASMQLSALTAELSMSEALWISDGSSGEKDYCTASPDIVPESCKLHDKDYSKESKIDRKTADDRFLENMKKELAERYPDMPQAARDAIANLYYKAVREFGHLHYEGQGVNDRVVTEGDDIPRIPRF